MLDMLILAARVALPSSYPDVRNFWLGSIGIRKDGILVSAKNGAAISGNSIENYQLLPKSHAEGRLVRKLGYYSTVYVARVKRRDYTFGMSRPCEMCRVLLTAKKVEKVYYTIDEFHYGIWYPSSDTDKIIETSNKNNLISFLKKRNIIK